MSDKQELAPLPGKLVEIKGSGFDPEINLIERRQQPSRFLVQAQWALAFPGKVVETAWPKEMNCGEIRSELNRTARQIGYKISASFRESLWERGVFQIKIGEKLPGDPLPVHPTK